MPSPVGHTLAGICGFVLARPYVAWHQQTRLLLASVFLTNLPDIDILPGLLLLGNPGAFHRQATHSLIVAALIGIFVAWLVGRWRLNRLRWGIWAALVYGSHIILDMLVADQIAPLGVQALWPFSLEYFISPVTILAPFDYFNPELGMVRTILSMTNVLGILWEIVVLTPLVGLAWYGFGTTDGRKPLGR